MVRVEEQGECDYLRRRGVSGDDGRLLKRRG